jgi:hypothetical protein
VAQPVARDVVGLDEVEVRVVQRADRRGGVEERVRVPDLGVEAELVADVRLAVAGVVDVDPVLGGVVEPVEVRVSGRLVGESRAAMTT